ncbi:MAG: 1,4-dihydroxy-2-naphthoate octaprenyltransferase [Betaproteobacteria bacterium]
MTAASPPSAPPTIRPGSWPAWRVALRPKTLWIATIPVIVATCLSWSLAAAFDATIAAIALAAAVLMQVVTNLQNDVGYTERGGETGTRVGLPRATASGWLSTGSVKRAIVAAIVAAQIVALPLMIRGGWPIVLTSVSSTVAAWAYMGGPRPIAYTPFGELTVFVFFGLVAVCGAYYVQAGTIGPAAWIAGAAIGMLAAAVLLVNNFRDCDHDATTGRRTLPVTLGASGAVVLYTLLVLAPFALAIVLAWVERSAWFALPLSALPVGMQLARDLWRVPAGPALTGLMFRTVLLEVAFGGLLSAAALLHRAV